ncbi:hypothetical protein GCM10018980_35180 [Streptomyces capoamus]|uniref:Uncharacterized protein n=1 Tax=Streptomyces capoamus TaxID=68183 RepID=A0A919C4U9_9ACTN|nr:hypothetical protein [Streptomyces capoamus]GGW10533.1 hypothetical protein GCM10010501_05790 [Streptomyces libani subsp. rufus]GHG51981.1 hypothetical protein GCM10018980_35180 [Streptomyces capoamus]
MVVARRTVVVWLAAAAIVFGAAVWLAHRINSDTRPDADRAESVRITDSGVEYEHGKQVFSASYTIHNDEHHAVTYTIVFDFEDGVTKTVSWRVGPGMSVQRTVSTPWEKPHPWGDGTPSEVRIAEVTTSE